MSRFLLVLTALASLALAASTRLSVTVNGRGTTEHAVVIDGRTYVPLSSLKLMGVNAKVTGSTLALTSATTSSSAGQSPAAGGANQLNALEGCIGETLFNGLWRVQITSLEAIRSTDAEARPGWAVNLEMRNGARKTLSMMSTGFGSGTGTGATLVLPDGRTLDIVQNDFLQAWSKQVIQGGVNRFTLRYFFPSGTPDTQVVRPSKFILQIDPRIPDYEGVKYSVPDPSLRVRLDCSR